MKTILAIFSLVLFSSTLANARLNETLEECITRYGKPVDGDAATGYYSFFKAPFSIIVHFEGGKVDTVTYGKVPNPELKPPLFMPLEDWEIQDILAIYGSSWRPIKTQGMQDLWRHAPGTMARYDYGSRRLTLATKEAMNKAGKDGGDTKGL